MTRTNGWNVWDAADVVCSGSNMSDGSPSHYYPGTSTDEPSFLCFDMVADGFLYNMVRAIVGTLIHVGRGRWKPEDMHRILELGDRTHAGETAPPQGLYLMRVDY